MKIHKSLGMLFFCFPYAPLANVNHADRLLDCLAPNCGYLAVVGDGRIDLGRQPSHIVRHGNIPTLHHLLSIRPKFVSAIWWIIKLIWTLWLGSWAVFKTRKQADVVICYKSYYYTPILLCARLLGKKTIIILPNNEVEAAKLLYQGNILSGLIVRTLNLMRIINNKLAHIFGIESFRLIEQLQIENDQHKARLGNLYLDTDFYTVSKPLEKRTLTVGFIGRLNPQKGIMKFLDAMALMHDSGIVFRIVGDGVLRQKIETICQRPEFSHVELVGWADNHSVVKHLNDFQLLVLPTLNEGVPNIVLEAMACGTPVLATSIGGIPDLIKHNVTGFILPDRNPTTIAQSIHEALKHPQLATIAKRGQEHVIQNYSLPAIKRQWANILQEVRGIS